MSGPGLISQELTLTQYVPGQGGEEDDDQDTLVGPLTIPTRYSLENNTFNLFARVGMVAFGALSLFGNYYAMQAFFAGAAVATVGYAFAASLGAGLCYDSYSMSDIASKRRKWALSCFEEVQPISIHSDYAFENTLLVKPFLNYVKAIWLNPTIAVREKSHF